MSRSFCVLYLLKLEKHSHCFLLISCSQLHSPFWNAQPCYFTDVNTALSAILLSFFVFSFLSLHVFYLICFSVLLISRFEMRVIFLLSVVPHGNKIWLVVFSFYFFFSPPCSFSLTLLPPPRFLPLCLSQRTMSECFFPGWQNWMFSPPFRRGEFQTALRGTRGTWINPTLSFLYAEHFLFCFTN